jgi:methylmalonyl-CoA mutase C-terminal domain/subunit
MAKKVLLAKPGLDGHDVGVKVLAHALIDAGCEVIYTGLRKSVEEIVARAKKENPDVIGLSILSGTHLLISRKMQEEMRRNDVHIPWLVGGNIPAADTEAIEGAGATRAFPTGTSIETVVSFIKSL